MEPVLKKQKVVGIVCARSSSSRLPRKHFLEVLGKPMLVYLIDRLKLVEGLDEIVIATTINASDNALARLASDNNVGIFRGSEDDVMGRVLAAAEHFGAEVICEVTGDCPLIDPALVDQAIGTFLLNDVAYVNNGQGGIPGGMGAQVYSTAALKKSESETDAPLDREHVTFHIRRHRDTYPAIYIAATPTTRWADLGIMLDEPDDYLLLKAIVEHFGVENPMFDCKEVIEFLRDNPAVSTLNKNVLRKGDS